MEALHTRRIAGGEQYDHLFPEATGKDYRVSADASVDDTISLISRSVAKTLWQTKKIAQVLKGNSLESTCRNIWDFVYSHIRYRKDEQGTEQVRSPRRSWHDRKKGVDCDCYTEFISSILTNLGIAHKARITIYDYANGYQHIYPVVLKNGRLDTKLNKRQDYIVMDCVKDAFDDEEPFLEFKDYNMKLEYLDGINRVNAYPADTDMRDFAELYESQPFGSLTTLVNNVKTAVTNTIQTVNEKVNPLTILLRKGLMSAMQTNVLNLAEKLRFTYLTEAQATKMNMNPDAHNKLKQVRERLETIYYQAGGDKAELRKAILEGSGNADRKVPLSGFSGYSNGSFSGLGSIPPEVIQMVMQVISSLIGIIKEIGPLFKKNTPESKAYDEVSAQSPNLPAPMPQQLPQPAPAPNTQTVYLTPNQNVQTFLPVGPFPVAPDRNTLPNTNSGSYVIYPDSSTGSSSSSGNTSEEGFFDKTVNYVKKIPPIVIGGAIAAGVGGYILYKESKKNKRKPLNGLPRKKKVSKRKQAKSKIKTIKI